MMDVTEFDRWATQGGFTRVGDNHWARSVVRRRYGCWTGNPLGATENTDRCAAVVQDRGGFRHFRQCSQFRKVGDLCRMHAEAGAEPIKPVTLTRHLAWMDDHLRRWWTINADQTHHRVSCIPLDRLAVSADGTKLLMTKGNDDED